MSTNADSAPKSPGTPVDKLRDVVASLIDVVATQGNRAIDTLGLRTPGRHWIPSVDIVEDDRRILVAVDLPGIDPNEVEILLTGNMLTVKGRPAEPLRSPGEVVHRRERPAGLFSRSIPLPIAVNSEQVNAEARNGVLTISLAKAERAEARQIPIGTPPTA